MHYRIAFLGILFFVMVFWHLAVWAQVPQRVPSNFSLQINGQVRYSASHAPAENVLVRIESFSGGLVNQVMTDRSGKFSFTGLTAMQYIVTVHAPGFIDVRENVDLLTANTGYLNVELIEDKNSVGADRPGAKPGVINASVPAAAQTEFTRAKTLLAANTPGAADDAIKSLEKAVAIYPKFLEAQIMLGLAYMDLRKWDKAERPLQSAIEINPQASTAYFALGEVYFREKMYPEAERAVQSGLRLEPGAAQGHLTLATIYWVKAPLAKDEQEFRTNAENAWKEVSSAIRIDPKLAEAHLLAGNLLLRARRANDALTEFETYLKLRPDGEFAAETNALVKKIRESIQTGPKQ